MKKPAPARKALLRAPGASSSGCRCRPCAAPTPFCYPSSASPGKRSGGRSQYSTS